MIPFASVSCLIRMAGTEMPDMEVSLRDLSAEHVRLEEERATENLSGQSGATAPPSG